MGQSTGLAPAPGTRETVGPTIQFQRGTASRLQPVLPGGLGGSRATERSPGLSGHARARTALFDHLKAGHNLDTFLGHFEGVTQDQAERVIQLAADAATLGLRAA